MKFISYFISIIFILCVLAWFLIIALGSAEILWWIFTGDFFHFVGEATANNTF